MANPILSPIEYRTLNDLVTEQLRTAILDGEFPPGTALNQRDIADRLSVSRMPVREAFRALEIEGLIRGLPRRKAVVVALQPEDVADIVDILAALESRAAEKAAGLIDEAGLARLRELAEQVRAYEDSGAGLLDLDGDFHAAAYQPPSARLSLLISTHRAALRPYWMTSGVLGERRQAMMDEHDELIAALAARDGARAAASAERHVRGDGRALVEHLRAT